jgi:UDP-galactopyranose mutase
MKVLIIGAGLSGCSIARLLKDKGSDVSIIEKKSVVGGLCITRIDRNGLKYEPFGARTFHTKNPRISEFITRFDNFNDYVHRKGMIINGHLFPFPITIRSLEDLPEKETILEELRNRPSEIDSTNFETACISIFGPTLYRYFIENYTRKMWGIEPRDLTAEWAPKRLELRESDNDELFQCQWQGIPEHGYSHLLEQMIKGIPITFQTTEFDPDEYDAVVSTAPIDEALHHTFGRLDYRSIRFHYQYDETWENEVYGTINLPQHPKYIRKCNFTVLHKQPSSIKRIQYQEPIPADEANIPMYPINTNQYDELFNRYLLEICKSKNICPAGRLGLFKYLDMDKAVEMAFDLVNVLQEYINLNYWQRYQKLQELRKRY